MSAGNGSSSSIPKEAVLDQLARIRGSRPFRTSKRCLSLLEYVVEQALDGHLERLKERSLGAQVFGRDPGYDTGQDPIVRYTAGEVRKRLAQYYQEPGHEHELRMDFPSGSYVPEFHLAPEPLPPPPPASKPRRRVWLALPASVLLILAGALWVLSWRSATVVDRFWEPVFSDSSPVLLSVGEAKVYGFREPLRSEIAKQAAESYKAGRPVPLVKGQLEELLPVWGEYIAIGNSVCVARLAAFLSRHGKNFSARGASATSLADLRAGPAVLIGAFSNDWTLRLTDGFRFALKYDSTRSIGAIWDRTKPQDEGWKVGDVWPHPETWTDYGLVSRIRHPSTGRVVITALGVDHCGSEAAAELLTSAEYLGEALRNVPSGWDRKNIQIVFSSPVVGDNVGPPKPLAVHVW
ncbi:conserved hypothetical protein [Candidatus Sulfopaludibacter sp. SbA6]|nr:conserved hypothetical protein [Candidatus Sulfopaludibacter sp. SbA6]